MTKKLYVPEHLTVKPKGMENIPTPIKTAFGKDKEESKNENEPSQMEASALERLPQPTGYRMLIIPYYPSEKTKGGVYVPDQVRDREALATVVAYVLKVGPLAYKDKDKFYFFITIIIFYFLSRIIFELLYEYLKRSPIFF